MDHNSELNAGTSSDKKLETEQKEVKTEPPKKVESVSKEVETEPIKMKLDTVLLQVGEFGHYQKRVYFLLCLPAILCAMHKLAWVFLGAKMNHRFVICQYY